MDCRIDGCERAAAPREGGLCHGHARRKRRGLPLNQGLREYGRSGAQRLEAAALRVANAETDEDHQRAVMWLLKAAQRLRRKKDNVRNQSNTQD